MENDLRLFELAFGIRTMKDLEKFLNELCQDAVDNGKDWENKNIDEYICSLARVVRLKNDRSDREEILSIERGRSLAFFAEILLSARDYE